LGRLHALRSHTVTSFLLPSQMGSKRKEFRDHHLLQNENLFKNRPITIALDRQKAQLPPATLPKLPKSTLCATPPSRSVICLS
jgi:hypothetical protein